MPFSPSFVFGLLLATLYGALAHLLLGGSGRRLLAYLAASWIGFALGQATGEVLALRALAVGPTNVAAATIGSLAALIVVTVLAGTQPTRPRIR